MKIESTQIPDVKLIKFSDFQDDRGFFGRRFCKKTLSEHGINFDIVQANTSFTKNLGVIRGLHFQSGSDAETKIIFCSQGAIFDVAVDLRKSSATFGKFVSYELSEHNKMALLVPRGFAHGFQTIRENSLIHYFVDNAYCRDAEIGLQAMDPNVNIRWPIMKHSMSSKDRQLPTLANLLKEKPI
jgi:dTDP-4-dehydrorhamnose 3,5-epimerase